MDGGVAIPNMPPQGFFQLPRPQVPHFQRPRFHPPFQNMPQPNHAAQSSSAGTSDTQTSTTLASSTSNTIQMSGSDLASLQFDGKRMRKAVVRKTVDYNTSVVKYLENRIWQRDHRDARAVQPDSLYQLDMVPPAHYKQKPMNCLTTKFMRQSTNKFRCPIFCLAWTPEGRRLVTGASSGEFTLWNGLTFSFETILQAHETSVRAMVWSHNDQWMVTGDHAGFIKYWQSNMNNVKMYQGHKEAIRGISLCPTDSKFASCSDDGTVRVWDFMRCYEEKILRGHGADVKCVDWHPQKSLIASGSKDNQVPVKLWDPKSGQSLATLHAHKFTVMDISWNQNGNWLLTAARDHLIKLFDIRNLKEELQIFKGHKKEATAVAWHPINEQMFASGGSDGAIMFWNAGTDKEVGAMEEAHDAIIWDLAWHPLGHVLVSGSNDHSTKFWTRNRPGDAMRDKYNLNIVVTGPDGEALDIDHDMPLGEAKSLLPGMGLEHGLPPPEEEEPEKIGNEEDELPAIPGLDWSADAQFFKDQLKGDDRPRKKTPYARPIPRSFEQAWITNQQPGTLVKEDGQMKRGKIQSLLTLELPDRPPPGLEYVDYDGNDSDVIRQPVDFNAPGQGFNPGLPGMLPPSVGLLPIPNPPNMAPNPEMIPNPGVPTPLGNDIDHRPKMGPGDKDYRSDQDYRQDQDLRGDSDYRGNDSNLYRNNNHENFRNDDHNRMMQSNDSGGPFRGDGPSPMKSGNFRGGASNRGSGRNQGPMGNFQDNRNDRNMNDSYDMDDSYDNYDDYGPSDMYRDNQGYEEDYPLNDSRQQGDWNMGYDQDDRMDYDQRRRSPSPNQSFNRNQGRDRKQSDRNRGGFKDRGRGGRGGDRGGFRGRGSGNRGSQQNVGDRGGRMDTGGWNDSGPQSDRDFDGNDEDFRIGRFNDSSERGGRNERGGRGNFRGSDRGGRGGDRGGRGGDRGGRGGDRGGRGDRGDRGADRGGRGGDRGGRGGRGGKRGRGNEHRGGRRGGRGGRGGN